MTHQGKHVQADPTTALQTRAKLALTRHNRVSSTHVIRFDQTSPAFCVDDLISLSVTRRLATADPLAGNPDVRRSKVSTCKGNWRIKYIQDIYKDCFANDSL